MISDANAIEDGAIIQTDICIVGGGAAGITIALSLDLRHMNVVLLESGGTKFEAAAQDFYDGAVVNENLHPPTAHYRRRQFGGTTSIWGGRCMPFDPIDFEKRPWIADSFWPIDYAEVAQYYPAAQKLCEAGEFLYNATDALKQRTRPILQGFKGQSFTDDTIERFSCPTNFAQRYGNRLAQSKNIHVMLHANVVDLPCDAQGALIRGATIATSGGARFFVAAKLVILAAGGMETPRLLLNARTHHARGIGNAYDQVGRNYLCHLAGHLGDLIPGAGGQPIFHGYEISDEGIYCRRRFALIPEAQRALQVGNFIARIHHPRLPDPAHKTGALSALYLAKPLISYEYRKRLHGEEKTGLQHFAAHIRNIIADPFDTSLFLLHWLRFRSLAARKYPTVVVQPKNGHYTLDFHAEQLPNLESRIMLQHERDRLGMQRIKVDWRYLSADIETVRKSARALAHDMAESGAATLHFTDDEVELSALRDGAYGGHHIGTARMSLNAKNGVVDRNCCVHGMQNLFIAGSAVFPTSGQANPTLTIVALAIRLAEYLEANFHKIA